MTSHPRSLRLALWAAMGLAGLAALVALRAWQPTGISSCLLYLFAGVPCPGCGMTRASALLARGDVRASMALHPLAIVFAVQAAVAWCWWGVVLLRRSSPPSPWWGIGTLAFDGAALTVIWVLRLWFGTLPG